MLLSNKEVLRSQVCLKSTSLWDSHDLLRVVEEYFYSIFPGSLELTATGRTSTILKIEQGYFCKAHQYGYASSPSVGRSSVATLLTQPMDNIKTGAKC